MTLLEEIKHNCIPGKVVINIELPEDQREYVETVVNDYMNSQNNLIIVKSDKKPEIKAPYTIYHPEEGIIRIHFKQ